ncbi:MAG: hypothetical protein ACREEM_18590 [Blastocatellia bacterium]
MHCDRASVHSRGNLATPLSNDFSSRRPLRPIPPFSLPARNLLRLLARKINHLAWARQSAAPANAHRRFTLLRLRFNLALSQFDIFADALTQRSEHGTGVWLAGPDVVAADALALPEEVYRPAGSPGLLCYLDRGHGAAIRRARTRLPGGGENPVAIVRVPRERMVGSGIASSLIHEVGHQAAAGFAQQVGELGVDFVKEDDAGSRRPVLWIRFASLCGQVDPRQRVEDGSLRPPAEKAMPDFHMTIPVK